MATLEAQTLGTLEVNTRQPRISKMIGIIRMCRSREPRAIPTFHEPRCSLARSFDSVLYSQACGPSRYGIRQFPCFGRREKANHVANGATGNGPDASTPTLCQLPVRTMY